MPEKSFRVVISVEQVSTDDEGRNAVGSLHTKTFDESEPISAILDYVHRLRSYGTSVSVKLTLDGYSWGTSRDIFALREHD